jgi:hypothetical protein
LDAVKPGQPEERVSAPRSALDRFRFHVKLVEGLGKLRRLFLSKLRRDYIERMKAFRRGECRRCGSCCAIMFRCPHLKEGNLCTVYEKRYEQCGHFPIDHRDLRYREETCGFYFVRPVVRSPRGPDHEPETGRPTRGAHYAD